MHPRLISIFTLLQIGALGLAILFSTLAARLAERVREANSMREFYRLPPLLETAATFRDFGIFSLLFVILWTALASHSNKPDATLDASTMTLSGIALTGVFFLVAILYFFALFIFFM